MNDLISRETALDAIDRIRLKIWLIDIPSPTVPEYIEHHEQIQHVLEEIAAVRKEVEQLPGIDEQRTGKWNPCSEPPKHHRSVLVRGIEAIGNVTVYKVMQWDVDRWRPTDYAPSIEWTEWSEIEQDGRVNQQVSRTQGGA